MKEKTKKALLVAGLIAVGILLVTGISMRLYREEKKEIPTAANTPVETEIVVDNEPEVVPETKEELVIKTESKTDIKADEQDLQPDPVKTEEEKPTEKPEVKEDVDMENPAVEPEYKEETTAPQTPANPTVNTDNTPSNGQTKDGMIYIDGFGWIPNEGGGGTGIVAEDMYENGNKIGIMD